MLAGLDWMHVAVLLLAGVLLDLALGEPSRFHPLVGFGKLARAVELRMNVGSPASRLAWGAAAWLLVVVPFVALATAAQLVPAASDAPFTLGCHAILLYACLGLRSLRDHILPIAGALKQGDLPAARALTSRIVSRDTEQASEQDLAKASTESLLENGNDAIFGTLFWFAIAGGPGVVLFRLANTLDAMWGYKNERYLHFGRAAARIDDVMNYLPARLTALSYALLAPGHRATRQALACWRQQAPGWSSPNAGPVMSSGAGALSLALGGAATYDGIIEQRPPLGCGQPATAGDILRAWRLVRATVWLWLAAALAVALAIAAYNHGIQNA